MLNLFGVAIFHTSMVNWRRRVHLVYVHSAICETALFCSGIPYYLWSIGEGQICHKYMCIGAYVKLIWCSGIP